MRDLHDFWDQSPAFADGLLTTCSCAELEFPREYEDTAFE